MQFTLPLTLDRAKAPPLKTQGIKTRLVPFIAGESTWDGNGKWVEPFVGSAAVLLNIAPQRALVGDTNPHIIEFYRGIQDGRVTALAVREYLEREGAKLARIGEGYYYQVRERFNDKANALDYLFLSRSCFNGLVRFNRRGKFNVPFCRKPQRFSKAYITKICNQVAWAASVIEGRDWAFAVTDWRETIAKAEPEDFVYLDPPYAGRHADFYSRWTDAEADELSECLCRLPCAFSLSTWVGNAHRTNDTALRFFSPDQVRTRAHWYHVGSHTTLRHEMIEGLVVGRRAAAPLAA